MQVVCKWERSRWWLVVLLVEAVKAEAVMQRRQDNSVKVEVEADLAVFAGKMNDSDERKTLKVFIGENGSVIERVSFEEDQWNCDDTGNLV